MEASRVRVTIDAKSLQTNVPGFADQLTGPDFLNAAKFPDATFVSTAVKRTGPHHGRDHRRLHSAWRDPAPDLVGGSGRRRPLPARPGLGLFRQGACFQRSDFGVGPVSPLIGDAVELVIDVEFDRPPDPEAAPQTKTHSKRSVFPPILVALPRCRPQF
ncbi:MAG: YceI family protein [Caulobacteraceae bacterium]